MVETLVYQPEGRGFETRWGNWTLSIDLILPGALGPGIYSASYRNENQRQEDMYPTKRARSVGEADNLTANCEPPV
jgi:hypothetical protein